ncbi:MAG: helicase C-terminal domain-containing protein, partial [Dissulfurispiraceae bacterium]
IGGLVEEMVSCTTGLFHEDEELEIKASIIKLKAFAEGMVGFTDCRDGATGFVRWAETEEKRIALRMSPVYPRDFMMSHIMPGYRSVILTSATLSVAGDFSFMTRVLGLEGAETLSVPSPFDFKKQIEVHIKRGINLRQPGSAEKLAAVIIEEASRGDGGMLVLFTSRESMRAAWAIAGAALREMGLNPMVQGEMPNRLMLEIMRESENSVIFGLDSFWEGVDVKGDSLKCLIMAKLPFEVPTEPIVKARTEEIELEGGNAFYEYSLPRAVLKFRQGFGRLIRSKSDSGRVIICDDRIETMAYGRTFLGSI